MRLSTLEEVALSLASAVALVVVFSPPPSLPPPPRALVLSSCCRLGLELAGRSEASATLSLADHHASWADSGSERIGVGSSEGEDEVLEGEDDAGADGGGGRASGGGGGGGGDEIGGDDCSESTTAVAIPLLVMPDSWSVDVSGTARARREVGSVAEELGRSNCRRRCRRRRRRKKRGSSGGGGESIVLPLVLATAADAA